MTPRLVSVNVGMPKDVPWNGKTVHTGIWKTPVEGPVMVRRLNIDGDGQGDLGGHGGEQRAVMVYQTESYDFWRDYLGRDDLVPGNFGENFTVSGLADRDVCIGDRYQIGDAEFEVTQPRVTCFRVGMRLGVPEMPNLLVSQHRPGFYFRVIAEGVVRAGDDIVLTRRGRHELSVADVDALLYLPDRNTELLSKAVDMPALSPGWQQSFGDMLVGPEKTSTEAGWVGFRPLHVTATHAESPTVLSIRLEADDGGALPAPLPGQYLTLKIPAAGDPPPMRSYSLSGDPSAGHYRISVKREEHGQVSRWLHSHAAAGMVIECAAPRGDFHLLDEDGPVVLVSAGVGATPVMAMAHALASAKRQRQVWWLHTTQSAATYAFAAEIAGLLDTLPGAHQHVFYTRDGDASSRLDGRSIAALGLPTDATAYLCGPAAFMADVRDALASAGLDPTHIHTELFGALPPINPGVVGAVAPPRPHPPAGRPGAGPQVTFARSGLSVDWSPAFHTLLEFAEACDVPTRYSCRSGVCHTCATAVIEGTTDYLEPPLEEPTDGTVLLCTATPHTDLVLDL
ncbi:ferredoxin-NADP reductase/MOSC domain-containing protein YiiM [Mycobacterium sp. OAS707]|uniref:MOSC domain-containing protein n=1 Tax=Mycobacterium sp. OAS707 TaxID=2663822 RepID=UPI00178A0B17|nr:MOSC domain-containing protein [Mycobacterium sp. OAS707]MBE1550644.1 ferredoxin-NADP reductase/MOSC domain-containing protein YiiM [Mycobacterium sp. OAS707]